MKAKLSTDERLWLQQIKAWKANQRHAIRTSQNDISQAKSQIRNLRRRIALSNDELLAKQKQLKQVISTEKLFRKQKGVK